MTQQTAGPPAPTDAPASSTSAPALPRSSHCEPGSKLCGDCMQAWLDRKPTPHRGLVARFEFGWACFDSKCWCVDADFGRLMIQGADGQLLPQDVPADFPEGDWDDDEQPFKGLEPGEEA